MTNLNDIVSVQIEIQSPATDQAGFSTMLILGSGPMGSKIPPDVGVYTSLESVRDAGWLTGVDPVYEAARIAFSQTPQPSQVYIAVRKKQAPSLEPTIPNEEENNPLEPQIDQEDSDQTEEFEPVSETLDRALSKTGWYLIVTAGVEESDYEAVAQWTEAHKKMFCFTTLSLSSPLEVSTYTRSFGIYGKTSEGEVLPEGNKYLNAAWAADCLRYEPGSETWAIKQLSAVKPSNLTATQMKTLNDEHLNYFTTYAGKNITQGGTTISGEWIDVIRFMDWLESDMQLRIFNLLLTNDKIMYTDEGIALIENQMMCSLKQGQRQYGIAETEYDEDNKSIPGFTVTVPRAHSLSLAERASRKLRGCKFTARLAGAVHFVGISGTLHY